MIAGFIALALGAQGLGILPFSENIGSYASVLIILIFAGVGINGFSFNKKDFKAEIDRIGSYFSYKVLAQAIQFSLAPLFSILVISKLFPNIKMCIRDSLWSVLRNRSDSGDRRCGSPHLQP